MNLLALRNPQRDCHQMLVYAQTLIPDVDNCFFTNGGTSSDI